MKANQEQKNVQEDTETCPKEGSHGHATGHHSIENFIQGS